MSAKVGEICYDGIDNDGDGNIDCADSDCDEKYFDTGSGNNIYCRGNLMWTETLSSGYSQATAINACANLSYGGFYDWSLPDLETLSIAGGGEEGVDLDLPEQDPFTCGNSCKVWDNYCCNFGSLYWSSSTGTSSASGRLIYWTFNFTSVYWNHGSFDGIMWSPENVRCVR